MKRFLVAIIGGTVLVLGITMLVLPGPAFLVIPAGLAILATKFLWARRALRRCKSLAAKAPGNLNWLQFASRKSAPSK